MDRVKTWFNQPARKHRRRVARQAKNAAMHPRPTGGLLRPIVHAPTVRYNMKVRKGRGFTLEELKAAGIARKVARSVGIAVDHRRKNHSVESLQENTQRLKVYKEKLIIFPGKGNLLGLEKATAAEIEQGVQQVKGDPLPIVRPAAEVQYRAVEAKEESVYHTLRVIRSDTRLEGLRTKRRKEKADEAAAEKK
ncbi:hypothetical protein KFE25_004517 [Diacronema lutheri]|uniref:60S ribosomal protein L13 n=1 Tax=Diacronema lutheri TaxID=2081491 RepID=A0A8J5X2Z9_DIALT|nr:hypothetical protein KFE25_013846 [Diacronema lutheri]KAG8458376.1 hypothetical protein KFE25_004517 [Diacronema lutheri]